VPPGLVHGSLTFLLLAVGGGLLGGIGRTEVLIAAVVAVAVGVLVARRRRVAVRP
jgi:hypothetical protein